MWDTIEDPQGQVFKLGDEIRVTCRPRDDVYQGFLNVIDPSYITLAGTGYIPIPGFPATEIGLPVSDIVKIEFVKEA